jgi:hypothetical protein
MRDFTSSSVPIRTWPRVDDHPASDVVGVGANRT